MQPSFTKKFLRIAIHLCLPVMMAFSTNSFSQVFWTEDFGSGCNTGFPADGLATANGTWTVDNSIGLNEPFANVWYISAHVNNNGPGVCANDCNGGNNQTLHISNAPVTTPISVTADSISYFTGFFCASFTICSETHSRAQSPVIDCSGKSNITLDFLYFEGGDVANVNGDATVWYNDGTTWSQLDPLAKTNNAPCSGTMYGVWTPFSISLPASADNNPNVRLGFQWDNDNSGAGSDPSTAFDDVTLTSNAAAPPVADFTANNTTICENDAVDFTDNSTGSPTSWSWTFTGGTPATSTSQNPTGIVYATAGTYDVKLVVTNANGSDSITKTAFITVNVCSGAPVPDFTANNTTICENDAVDFTDNSTGSPTSWSWTFTGGTPATSTSQNPSGIVYTTAGTYDVKLVATNANGSDSITKTGFITVNVCGGVPDAEFSASNTVVCEGDLVDFTDQSTNSPTSWQWTFAGGSPGTSTAQNPTGIQYASSGVFDVTLVATNGSGSNGEVKVGFITVNVCGSAPVAFFFANDTNICDSDAVDFTDLSTNAPTSWDWTFAGGTPSNSTLQNPTGIVYNVPGIYTVQLIATNATGSGTSVRTNYITVTNCVPPTADFLATDTAICVGDSVHFTNLSTGNPTTFQWTFFGATPPVSTSPNPSGIIYPTAGLYTVQLIVSNSSGTDTLVITNYVNVNACLPPIAAFSATQTVLCEGSCIDSISDQSFNEPTTWLWLFPGSNVPSSQLQRPPSICYSDSGFYNITLIVTNPYGSDTLVQIAYIEVDTCPKPIIHFIAANDTFFCSENCIDFTNTSDNMDTSMHPSYHWIFPGSDSATSNVSNPTNICYPNEGVFDVVLVETNDFGSDTLVMQQYITVINVPNAYTGPDQSVIFGGSVQLNSGGGVSYLWSWDPSSSPDISSIDDSSTANPIVTPHVSDQVIYNVEITDSTTGCKTNRQVTVEILHNDHIFVPNSFKPTSSGANSTVGVYATNVKSLTFAIYDKWGEKVFESHSTCPDTGPCDPSGWDGKYNGKDCEMGTYVYTVFLITTAGNVYHQNGNVTLIR